ncbi:centrosomal protein of 112 kDa-like isoform X2 [Lineus longissimus]|uniref:centrosomal protein of 112 kDa-like isoform X2 n=1 Tax=Lineus longissimus TaxID=88925 RepID=UPI00315D83AC
MDSETTLYIALDETFDQHLAEMKPFVLKLPHKTERQRCALWIKKLCEPPSSGITGRKNRNMYAELMLHMLKRGALEGPFTSRPEEGPLQTLPAYMSIYFDDKSKDATAKEEDKNVPDWVSELGASQLSTGADGGGGGLGGDAELAAALKIASSSSDKEYHGKMESPRQMRRSNSTGRVSGRGRSPSPPHARSFSERDRMFSRDELGEVHGARARRPRTAFNLSSDDEDTAPTSGIYKRRPASRSPPRAKSGDPDYTSGRHLSTSARNLSTSTSSLRSFRDETSLVRIHEKELDMKTKMMEAKFHEEKLKIQQKHDIAVQKILDRKNTEIEDVKSHYRTKVKDQEEAIGKLERKLQALSKEHMTMKESKDKHISELKDLVEETSRSKQKEFDRKFNDVVTEFEREKFDMQKVHTKNIQELLDDTNTRLQKMEEEYSRQASEMNVIIKELETRVQQLTADAEQTTHAKCQLEGDKIDMENRVERLSADYEDLHARHSILDKEHNQAVENYEQELRALKNKNDAMTEFTKQEAALAAAKSADTIADLEHHVNQLKKSMEEVDTQRQRQIREMEQVQQQDKMHLEHLNEKKIRSLEKEMDQLEQESQKQIRKLESTISERNDEIRHLEDQIKMQAEKSEQALDDFKSQVEKNSNRMYDEMKHQMEKVEADLNKSKQMRERQTKEFNKQMDETKMKYEKELAEQKMKYEQDRGHTVHTHHKEREMIHHEHEQEIELLKENFHKDRQDLEERARQHKERDAKIISDFEQQVRMLREEVASSNNLRKQQLVELGLLREEEKQKSERDHECQIMKMKSQLEQQRLDLQKMHSAEMERTLEKTNSRLKDIEQEYSMRNLKAADSMSELQTTIEQLRNEHKREREKAEQQFMEALTKSEEERRNLRRQQASTFTAAQQQMEMTQNRTRELELKTQQLEMDHEEKILQVKLQYEQRIRGLMPAAMQRELEDTITSLQEQVTALQQRVVILQEDLDMHIITSLWI